MSYADTIVALSTPEGSSAIALIRMSGPDCFSIAQDILILPKKVLHPRVATLAHYKDIREIIIDQIVAVYYEQGVSYTGDAMLELSIHGNPFIIQKILEDLINRGCRMAEPGEFTRRAFLNKKIDLCQAEAVADIIRARSESALQAAHKQLSGELGKRLEAIKEQLLQVIAEYEAYIDFPEDDLPHENTSKSSRILNEIYATIKNLLETQRYSNILHEGVKTVILGAPNVGKSSMLNALIGKDRAIVSDEPGTTRDFIDEPIIIGNTLFRLIDTAGIHETHSELEKIGIQKTLEKAKEADFYLLVLDVTQEPLWMTDVLKNCLKKEKTLIVENKIDLPNQIDLSNFLPEYSRCRISIKTEEGIDLMRKILHDALFKEMEESGCDIVLSARQASAMDRIQKALDRAFYVIREEGINEFAVAELREALVALGDVLGHIDNEAILDKLFKNFCIGK